MVHVRSAALVHLTPPHPEEPERSEGVSKDGREFESMAMVRDGASRLLTMRVGKEANACGISLRVRQIGPPCARPPAPKGRCNRRGCGSPRAENAPGCSRRRRAAPKGRAASSG